MDFTSKFKRRGKRYIISEVYGNYFEAEFLGGCENCCLYLSVVLCAFGVVSERR